MQTKLAKPSQVTTVLSQIEKGAYWYTCSRNYFTSHSATFIAAQFRSSTYTYVTMTSKCLVTFRERNFVLPFDGTLTRRGLVERVRDHELFRGIDVATLIFTVSNCVNLSTW